MWTMNNIKELLKEQIKFTDGYLDKYLAEKDNPQNIIYKAMRYSVFAGGKRLLSYPLSGSYFFRFLMDHAFHVSATFSGVENKTAESGFISLCRDRICRGAWSDGKAEIWLWSADLGTWYLYEGKRRGTYPCKMGRGNLQKYMD